LVLCKAQSLIELMCMAAELFLHFQLTLYEYFSRSMNAIEIKDFGVPVPALEGGDNSGRYVLT
jgi:hypothetical protein